MSVYDDVALLQQQMTEAQANITTLQQRATTAEQEIETLQTGAADSGWIPLPLESGITTHNAEYFPCKYRRIGNTVHVRGCIKGFSDVVKVVAILPEGYRPSESFYTIEATQGGNVDTFNVRTNGEIKRTSTTMPVASLSDENYHFIDFDFLIN